MSAPDPEPGSWAARDLKALICEFVRLQSDVVNERMGLICLNKLQYFGFYRSLVSAWSLRERCKLFQLQVAVVCVNVTRACEICDTFFFSYRNGVAQGKLLH